MQPHDSNNGDSINPIPPRIPQTKPPLDPAEGFSDTVHPDGDAGDEFNGAMHQSAQKVQDREDVLEDIMARMFKGEAVSLVFARPEDVPHLSAFKLCVKDGQLAIDEY